MYQNVRRTLGITGLCISLTTGMGTAFAQQPAGNYDLLIQGGRVVDGTGTAAYPADVLVKDGKIAFIGKVDAAKVKAARTVAAQGRVLAPGFIDTHSHGDPLGQSFENFLAMGVTTVVLGQDGASAGIEEDVAGKKDLPGWMEQAAKTGVQVNVVPMSGHGTVRQLAGIPDGVRALSAQQQSAMNAVLAADLKAGSFGMSTGLEYVPGIYSEPKEVAALGQVVKQYDGIVMSHMRSEDDDKIEASIEELIAQNPTGRVHISHLKVVFGKGAARGQRLLDFIEGKRKAGINLTADMYPYTAGYTGIGIIFPEWALPPTDYKKIVATRGPELLEYLNKRMIRRGGPEALLFGSEPYVGKTLKQISDQAKKPFAQMLMDLGPQGGDGAHFIMDQALQDVLLLSPLTAISTDGGPGARHPRSTGTYARMIELYVNKNHALTLEQAVHKSTGWPAQIMGLKDRGVLKAGARADLILFDPKKVHEVGSYVDPLKFAEGFDLVLVNGKVARENGKLDKGRYGEIVRKR